MQEKLPTVYILASRRNGTLYIGVTSNLIQRIAQHREGFTKGFAYRYRCHLLVYYAVFDSMEEAILREKQLKRSPRKKKLQLIETFNAQWKDVYLAIV